MPRTTNQKPLLTNQLIHLFRFRALNREPIIPPTSSTAKHAAPAALQMAARDVRITAVSGSIDTVSTCRCDPRLPWPPEGRRGFDRVPPDNTASASASVARPCSSTSEHTRPILSTWGWSWKRNTCPASKRKHKHNPTNCTHFLAATNLVG